MCLRYAFVKPDRAKIRERFALDELPSVMKPRYNIAPNQVVPAILAESPKKLQMASWGILPPWAAHVENAPRMYNARGETVDIKPFFKKSFAERRCLMVADSFYEWRKPEKTPFQASLKGGAMFAFAGIYTLTEGEEIRSVCMITTAPNTLMAPVHDRMPVILRPKDEDRWLNGTPEEAKELLKAYPAKEMEMRELTKAINSSRTDSADLVVAAKKDGQGKLF